jgi:hypothetical protein
MYVITPITNVEPGSYSNLGLIRGPGTALFSSAANYTCISTAVSVSCMMYLYCTVYMLVLYNSVLERYANVQRKKGDGRVAISRWSCRKVVEGAT